jgi:hypothetical protein
MVLWISLESPKDSFCVIRLARFQDLRIVSDSMKLISLSKFTSDLLGKCSNISIYQHFVSITVLPIIVLWISLEALKDSFRAI